MYARPIFLLLLALAALPAATAGEGPADAPPHDATAIRWTLPGHFADARERARTEHRIVVIKGISFGVDAEGATCATKGTW